MKIRDIEVFMIFCCAIAAGLCYAGSNWAAPCFIVSSSAGLLDSVKHKAFLDIKYSFVRKGGIICILKFVKVMQ